MSLRIVFLPEVNLGVDFMKIVTIFDNYLDAIVYPKDCEIVWNEEILQYFKGEDIENIDEFQRMFALWTDPSYLYKFFKDNKHYFESDYWKDKGISFDDMCLLTQKKALDFEASIYQSEHTLDVLFQPLDDMITNPHNVSKTKSKYSWLRIYAIKIDENRYLVTGGAIKLTLSMQDHPITKNELIKLEKARNYLLEKGVIDSYSYQDMLYELTI